MMECAYVLITCDVELRELSYRPECLDPDSVMALDYLKSLGASVKLRCAWTRPFATAVVALSVIGTH